MGLLAQHLQVHPGLLHAVVEVLAVADRPLTKTQLAGYLRPDAFTRLIGTTGGGVDTRDRDSNAEGPDADDGDHRDRIVGLSLDAANWLGLVASTDAGWQLAGHVGAIDVADLDQALPRIVRRGLFDRDWPGDLAEAQKNGGDLGLALSWYLAQDSWSPPRRYEKVDDSIESRQSGQFTDNPEYINLTKWRSVRRWLLYLGLGVPDPVDPDMTIPDPTHAVRDELADSEDAEWSITELVSVLSDRCGALDTGTARTLAMAGLKADELRWEHDPHLLSPSLSLALLRLEGADAVELLREADAAAAGRVALTAPGDTRVVDRVRKVGEWG